MSSSQRPAAIFCLSVALCLLVGCANPGPPKPPSLQIPAVPRGLSAIRRGNTVELQFELPMTTTDGLSLRSAVTARVCRAVETGPCLPVPGVTSKFPLPTTPKTPAALHDELPADLVIGPPRLLTYRVELANNDGRVGGLSEAAYAAAGAAPSRVAELSAQGSRLGVVLRWQPSNDAADVVLRREDLQAAQKTLMAPVAEQQNSVRHKKTLFADEGPKKQSAVILLKASGDGQSSSLTENNHATLDTSAVAETPYRYTAERRRTVSLGGHDLEMWSGESAPITFTLHDMFPPPSPTNLSVAGFTEAGADGKNPTFKVDLIWEPVQDEQLAGYKVYRQELTAGGSEIKQLLTPSPVKLPAFHDAGASGSRPYRYSVTSIDLKGNESEAATVMLEPQSSP